MIRQLWQRLVIWYGLRYNRWPPWWFDASDVTWTTVTGENLLSLAVDGELAWTAATIAPNGGDITICPEAFDE